MADIHTGSWGLPDFGLTEAIGGLLGVPNNQQGGSNLSGNSIISPVPASQTSSLAKGTGGTVNGFNTKGVLGDAVSVYNPPAPQPAPAPSGGGSNNGGLTLRQQMERGLIPWDDNKLNSQGPSQDEINKQINDAYGSSYDYLNKVEQNLRDQLPSTLNSLNANYDLNAKMLGDQNTNNVNQLNDQVNQANIGKETQTAQIRRLYNELGQGYNQRFGGSTSAGQAASEIANVEQQRQTGQLAQKYNDTVRQIGIQQANIQQTYQDSLLKLQQQKQDSITQANQDFQNKLLSIAQNRAELDTNKAQARLSALLDLRNKVFAIEQQNTQFQQTLEAQRQAAQLQLQQYAATATNGLGTANNAYSDYQNSLTTPTSNLQAKSSGGAEANPLTGSISTSYKDPYANLIGSIAPQKSSYDYMSGLS